MNKIYTTTVALLASIMFFAACGNAGAQNDKKTDNAPKAVTELDAESFTKQVFDMGSEDLVFLGDKPAIVDFTASWCGPCKRIAPILEELAKEYDGQIVIYKVDVDTEKWSHSDIPAAKPGEEVKFRVHLDTAGLPAGETLAIVTLTTNSPLRPIVNLFITGWLE